MHELSLAEAMLQLIEDAARRQDFAQVRGVKLEIGALAGVEPEAMRFCFDAVTRGSVAEGARLEIVTLPGAGWCAQCAESFVLAEQYCVCPRCGAQEVKVSGGREMRLMELEVV